MHSKIRDCTDGSIEAKVSRYTLFKSRKIKSWKQRDCLAAFTDSFEGKWTFYSTLIQCNDRSSGQERNSERELHALLSVDPEKTMQLLSCIFEDIYIYTHTYVYISVCRLNGDSLPLDLCIFTLKLSFYTASSTIPLRRITLFTR